MRDLVDGSETVSLALARYVSEFLVCDDRTGEFPIEGYPVILSLRDGEDGTVSVRFGLQCYIDGEAAPRRIRNEKPVSLWSAYQCAVMLQESCCIRCVDGRAVTLDDLVRALEGDIDEVSMKELAADFYLSVSCLEDELRELKTIYMPLRDLQRIRPPQHSAS